MSTSTPGGGNPDSVQKLLACALEQGGLETDDVLAALLPLMGRVSAAHAEGRVAPLRGLGGLSCDPGGHVTFDPGTLALPQRQTSRVEQLQTTLSRAVEVIGRAERTADVDTGTVQVSNLEIGQAGQEITRPVYLPGYLCWEHVVDHHDELTDIFSLGLLLASLACGLDFRDTEDLERFADYRENLFALNNRLNPVLASVIGQMTHLNRHRRAQDLGNLIRRLEHYREQAADFDTTFSSLKGFKESALAGKRTLIQAHLRDRLFEISRRNRLIYFRPTLQTLNLTEASVPLTLEPRNIRLEQLFVWHPKLAETITGGAPMSLGQYLRFEDAPYLPSVLDKIISEARRDRAEYGFAQLRLVLCFLRWANLKEAPQERIHSPLLLLPVELTRKKGVRDNYVLDPTTTEAEVNPALRHHLKELYNLSLPESIDLRETTLDQFYQALQAQIQASEPGVTLELIDRPQIQLIHERARQRVEQYRRRLKVKPRPARPADPADYNYARDQFRPLGLQLFVEKIRPAPLPLREAAGASPTPRVPNIVPDAPPQSPGQVLETERQMFALRSAENEGSTNPYSWSFDLCCQTLGNFNYRKMTLVRDYANLIETDLASTAFDTLFSLAPRPTEEALPPLELAEQHLIIPCDATQASAIARARTGRSYIIQGPPGTGKSQTITNLIADYAARGKRVLFVCEKRAAIDIVFHRLRQQGLDELCCLIHDSQTDKKAFILNLKQTYEQFLAQTDADDAPDQARTAALRAMEHDLANLRRFSDAMRETYAQTGLPLRTLLHRLIELQAGRIPLDAKLEELLPDYPLWLEYGELIGRLASTLVDLGEDPCFAKHPARWLGQGILQADRPLETLTTSLDETEELLDEVENALELSGLSPELWDTIEEIQAIVEFAARARLLAERDLLGLLDPGHTVSATFANLTKQLDEAARAHRQAGEKTRGWHEPLAPDDTQSALSQARAFERSLLRFLQPGYWRLRKVLNARYDFAKHAVTPSWTKVLQDLAAEHAARETWESLRETAQRAWSTDNAERFREEVHHLRNSPELAHPSIRALAGRLAAGGEAKELVQNLSEIHARFAKLTATLRFLLAEHQRFDFAGLTAALNQLREQAGILPDLLPLLSELAEAPAPLGHALRHTPLPARDLEAAMGRKSLGQIYRQDRALSRCEGRILTHWMSRLDKHYHEWLRHNSHCLRRRVRRQFRTHVQISSSPASQLSEEQKAFKKSYSAGRRDLEHEFGKTMRYKSIRELAAGQTGQVIQDLKPVWLMSPLSVSDTLPLDPQLFDVVIFDEASQIPVEEAIPAVYRSNQVIVVGDEMQLPPTTFFAASRGEDETVVIEEEGERVEVDLDSDSFLTQSATNLPSTLLAWHYRSRSESLISFSNAAYYSGNLFTIPDRQKSLEERPELNVTSPEQGATQVEALLARSVSFHFLQRSPYGERRNPGEAAYIAHLVRGLLQRDTKLSLGIVAFSEAQQAEIEDALSRLAEDDADFAARLENAYTREEDDQFCGLFVKNLENVQGDERDIIILSICYGPDAGGRMLMNFGPINQRGGEKRLNVIFSRAKHHMAVVSSIRHQDITNDYNDGANSLKNFLHYAQALSRGDEPTARRVLENLNPLARKSLAPMTTQDAAAAALAEALRARGYAVDLNVGQSKFRCDLAVRLPTATAYQLGILLDTEAHYANNNLLDRYVMQPSILRAFGWRFALVLAKDWFHQPEDVLARIERLMKDEQESPLPDERIEEFDERPTSRSAPPTSGPAGPAAASSAVRSAPASTSPARPAAAMASAAPSSSAATTPPTAASSTTSHARYFEFVGGGSRKFWEVTLSENTFTVRYGRIGASGQSQSKTFPDAARARREMDKLIEEKLKKGYEEKTGG
jgi:predicted DNA-binding WGR domain protein/MoxR-like ATPase